MKLLGFESKQEKEMRLKVQDMENENRRKEAKKQDEPFFGIKYTDDFRIK